MASDSAKSTGNKLKSTKAGLSNMIAAELADYFAALPPDARVVNLHKTMVQLVEKPLIEKCLERTGHNQLKAARMLGLNRNTLRRKIRDLGIRCERTKHSIQSQRKEAA